MYIKIYIEREGQTNRMIFKGLSCAKMERRLASSKSAGQASKLESPEELML